MLVREYLHESGWTKEQLAEFLGHKSTSMVTKKMEIEMPKRWARMLDDPQSAPSAVADSDSDARAHTDPQDKEWEHWDDILRDTDAPTMPSDTSPDSDVVGPTGIRLTTVEGYIQSIYGGAAFIAERRGDEIAADTIKRYTPEFSDAWINYIKSDPRLLEYLEKMMIGTPLGNLIGVHVIAIGSYVFARAAAREIAGIYTEESVIPDNGTVGESPSHFMG